MKDFLKIQNTIKRFRYGIKPKSEKRKAKRLIKMIELAFEASIIEAIHGAAIRASVAAEKASITFPIGGIHANTKDERNESFISKKDIAFIAQYHRK